jgi:hypothetical protein
LGLDLKRGLIDMRSNFVNPEPDRRTRKTEAVMKLVSDVLLGREKPSKALQKYKETANKIKLERKLDRFIKY